MSKIDIEFNELVQKVLVSGKEYVNERRGVKRLQIPSYTFRHDFEYGFPALSLKKLAWKSVVSELIWFLRGDTDIFYLNQHGNTIWNKDAYNWHKKEYGVKALSFDEFNKNGLGLVGKNYSYQWRKFNGKTDQIKNIIDDMKSDIMGSRIKLIAWNPSEINDTALPPCHTGFQIIGVPLGENKFGFELHWQQRSVDVGLGIAFNIASYALLAKILEQITGYKALAIQGDLKCVHLYENQIDMAKELFNRDCFTNKNCDLNILYDIKSITDFNKIEPQDFELINYTYFDAIKVDMIAPKEI